MSIVCYIVNIITIFKQYCLYCYDINNIAVTVTVFSLVAVTGGQPGPGRGDSDPAPRMPRASTPGRVRLRDSPPESIPPQGRPAGLQVSGTDPWSPGNGARPAQAPAR